MLVFSQIVLNVPFYVRALTKIEVKQKLVDSASEGIEIDFCPHQTIRIKCCCSAVYTGPLVLHIHITHIAVGPNT